MVLASWCILQHFVLISLDPKFWFHHPIIPGRLWKWWSTTGWLAPQRCQDSTKTARRQHKIKHDILSQVSQATESAVINRIKASSQMSFWTSGFILYFEQTSNFSRKQLEKMPCFIFQKSRSKQSRAENQSKLHTENDNIVWRGSSLRISFDYTTSSNITNHHKSSQETLLKKSTLIDLT